MSQTVPVHTFICYAHEDRDVVEDLKKQLAIFEKKRLLNLWSDGAILAGEEWGKAIKTQLEQADLILLFISVDFINSDYIETKELKAALERHANGLSVIVPIIVRACHWQEYFEIGRFQALPLQARPIFSNHFPHRDDAFFEIADGVRKAAEEIRTQKDAALKKAVAARYEQDSADRNRIKEEAAWEAAEDDNTIEAYETYLAEGFVAHKSAAEQRIKALETAAFKQKTQEAARLKAAAAEVEQQRLTAEAAARKPRNGDTFRDADDLPEMIYVAGGTFEMGSKEYEDEQPIHTVTLPGFYMGKYAITQAEWRNLMPDNPSGFKGDQLPVENVSWEDVQIFIKKMRDETGRDYRLPSEAEWEYAARGGNISKGYTYAGSNQLEEVGWFKENAGSKTHPVGQKKPNELGLYDMTGNVWEWCEDDWHNGYVGAPTDGMPWIDRPRGAYRVFRGGCWNDDPQGCRAAYRNIWYPDNRGNGLGLRLVFALQSDGSLSG